MNLSNKNFVDLTNETMGTNVQMPQPPPLMRRTDSTMQVVNDIICIKSDCEDAESNTPVYRGVAHPGINSTIGSHRPNQSQGKIVTIRKNDRIFKIMIPRNVIPNMSNSPCPVTLNIPGIGPLKIKMDPFVKYNTNPMPPSLSPFSLNLDDSSRASFINNSTIIGEKKLFPRKRSANTSIKTVSKKSPIKSERFCYIPHMGIINTFGFGITECRQPRKCLNVLNTLIKKMKFVLNNRMKELKRLTKAPGKKTREKTLPINKIGETYEVIDSPDRSDHDSVCNSSLLVTKKVVILNDGEECQPRIRKLKKRRGRPKKHKTHEVIDMSDRSDHDSVCNSSLLVTKKVVILNDGEECQPRIRKFKKRRGRPKKNNKQTEKYIRTCYVKLIRDPFIEKVYRDFSLQVQNDVEKSYLGKKHNTHSTSKVPAINIQEFVIDTVQKFNNHIAYIKPITVINEHNYRSIKSYKIEFCRTNIVFALKDCLPEVMQQDADFVTAVSNGYVKLVNDELLCSYFLR